MAVEVVSSVPSSPPSSAEGLAPMSAKGLVSACGKAVVEGSWRTDVVVADGDTGAVDLVDGAVDELEVERVRDHLVAADDILQVESALSSGFHQEGLSCQRARASRVEQVRDGHSGRGSFAAVGEAHLEDKHIGGGWVCIW